MWVALMQKALTIDGAMLAARVAVLRGAIVNRTYGVHKNLQVCLFSLTAFGPIYYGPPK